MKRFSIIAGIPQWLWLVAKKWIGLLGLLPAATELASTYIPGFPQIQIGWQWSVGIGCLGILASAYLVYRDLKIRLAVYEDHEPEYNLQVLETSAKACQPDQVHIECEFRMANKTPWLGELVGISLADGKLPAGIRPGMISSQSYQPLDWHCYNMLKFPFAIPPAGCDFKMTVHYPIGRPLEPRAKSSWEHMTMSLWLIVGYETQPIGYVQKCVSLNIPVNLGGLFEELESKVKDSQ